MPNGESCECPGADEILRDLDDDLLELAPDERLWKLYCFRAADHATDLRHRIYTKRRADGRLSLVTFAAHNPPNPEDNGGASGPRSVRSALARVPDLSPDDLDRLIEAMQAQTGGEACEEIDLSRFATLDEQLSWLRQQLRR